MSIISSSQPHTMTTPTTQSAAPLVPARSRMDRLRHVLLFELLALSIAIPAGSSLFGLHESTMGIIGIGSAITAMLWNYLYNLVFDRVMTHLYRTTHKTLRIRLVHTLLFEAGLQVVLLPGIALYTHAPLLQTFSLSLSLALFYLVYAFVFNMAYDRVFPLAHKA